ncbi:hypothetical protein OEZ85_011938 [Tetradesmus obliquus]|uniref:AAA+ ATPase domain-containing protein n=1 Tax=Tetradesmus obliquus TaxID=3088 RepID=A0ABY8TU58_TETOB|nr:hypothetical protein OEZ85_011938 [Tetradesmus obliquus]
MAVRAALRQVPDAPGTPSRPHHAPHIAARHHLQQYLASIDRSSFVDDLAAGIWAGNRLAISRSLTLCESTRPDHALQAAALLRKLIDNRQQQRLLAQEPHSSSSSSNSSSSSSSSSDSGDQQAESIGQHSHLQVAPAVPQQQQQQQQPASFTAASHTSSSSSLQHSALRIGVSGPPGAGKSSLIETWGCYLADHGNRVAVLAVDPSSAETGGAILGDKTRMARLSSHPNAYVRPSPARGTLGGVSRATYDAMLIVEAAGYDAVLVETVGVGQSEVAVADLVDCMLLVMPPVGGDDLQMIKRGIMEVADVVLVNKADGATEAAATRAAAEYGGCLKLMPHRYQGWSPQVLAVSAFTGRNVPALARLVAQFQEAITESGELDRCRVRRAEAITWLSLEEALLGALRHDPHTRHLMERLLPCVRAGAMAPRSAADIALSYFYEHCG